jgi:hypothetical protein
VDVGRGGADHAARALIRLGAGRGLALVLPPKGNAHVHREHLCSRHRGGRTAARDAACGAMTDRTIPVIFWTVMALLLVSLLVLVLAS